MNETNKQMDKTGIFDDGNSVNESENVNTTDPLYDLNWKVSDVIKFSVS